MNNQFVITADIFGHQYFLRFVDAAMGWTLATYEGLKDNAMLFDSRPAANTKMLTVVSGFHLMVRPYDHVNNPATPRQPLNERLRALRKASGKNQGDVAEAVHVLRSTYQAYEDGRARPPLDIIIAIAQHFGVTIEELVKGNMACAGNAK
jgi:DNA-binding XRE family transcriptional regulator